MTTVIVANYCGPNQQSVLAADPILVLRDGVTAEHGRHDELIGAGGTYTKFRQQRSRAAGWRLVKQ